MTTPQRTFRFEKGECQARPSLPAPTMNVRRIIFGKPTKSSGEGIADGTVLAIIVVAAPGELKRCTLWNTDDEERGNGGAGIFVELLKEELPRILGSSGQHSCSQFTFSPREEREAQSARASSAS
jgi:hypothetical protein